jgi:ribonuclease HI
VPLTAKYPATCGVCAASIQPGEQIAKSGSRWAHAACVGDSASSAGSAAAASAAPAGGSVSGSAGGSSRAGAGGRTTAAKRVPAAMAEPAGATEVWTDGACSGNPGPGGWAWATKDGRQGSGGAPGTTNQRMEIQAALEAVKALEGPLVVVSDSTYVVNCFRDGWWKGWLARGWVNSAKKPVANRDLWEPLVELFQSRDVSFRWVKGHSGDPMNDLVDRLAVEAGKAIVRS